MQWKLVYFQGNRPQVFDLENDHKERQRTHVAYWISISRPLILFQYKNRLVHIRKVLTQIQNLYINSDALVHL
jgi:hypothetical protein